MAQDGNTAGGNSYTIDNVTFPVGRTKLNSIFNAVRTTNMGSSAPDLVAGQFWIDNTTPSATVWTMYFYDGTDSIQFATIDTTNNTVNFIDSTFTQLTSDLATNGNDINFGDNDKAQFGASNDLQIYHDGSHSYISDQGTGQLRFLAENFQVRDAGNTSTMIYATPNSSVQLYHNNSTKLATTSTGIDVTGTVVSDGLTVDTNTFYVDSTNNKVGIGLTNPNDLNSVANNLVIGDGTTQKGLTIYSGTTGSGNLFFADGTTGDAEYRGYLEYIHTSDQFTLGQAGLVRFRINSTESVFNESSYDHDFRVESNNNTHALFVDGGTDNVFMGANNTNIGVDALATGFYFRSGGQFRVARSGSQPIIANRLSSDGDIIDLRKDGVTVGTIGTVSSGNLVLEGDTSLRLHTDGQERLILDSTECIFNNASYDQDFRVESNNNTHALFVQGSDGNIGIGTSTLPRTLNINNSSANCSIGIDSGATSNSQIAFKQGGTDKAYLTYWDVFDTLALTDGSGNGLHFNPVNRRVGIGTTNPTHELMVAGGTDTRITVDGSTSSGLYLTDSGASGITIRNTNDGTLEFLPVSGKSVVFNQNSVDCDFRIESNNNGDMFKVDAGNDRIGIGTNAPQARLHVNGTVNNASDAKIYLTEDLTPRGMYLHYDGDTNINYIGGLNGTENKSIRFGRDGNDIRLYTANYARLFADSSEMIINDESQDFDFRVESNANTHALFVDGGQSAIGINNSLPSNLSSSHTQVLFGGTGSLLSGGTSAGSTTEVRANSYYDGSNHRYSISDEASRYKQNDGTHQFDTASAGTAGNTLTWNTRMKILENGNVGIGTTSPSSKLDINGDLKFGTSPSRNNLGDYGSTDLYLINQNSSGTTQFYVGGGTSDKERMRLSTTGAVINDQSNDYDFRIESNTSSHAFFVDGASGNVLVGTSNNSPAESTTANGTRLGNNGGCQFSANGLEVMRINRNTNDGRIIGLCGQTTVRGEIAVSGTVIQYTSYSDHRLKEDVQQISNATESLKQLNPVNFAWIENGVRNNGFLAHEVQSVVPEAVTGTHNEVDSDGNPVYQGLDQAKLVPLLTASLKEAINKIEQLEARISALET